MVVTKARLNWNKLLQRSCQMRRRMRLRLKPRTITRTITKLNLGSSQMEIKTGCSKCRWRISRWCSRGTVSRLWVIQLGCSSLEWWCSSLVWCRGIWFQVRTCSSHIRWARACSLWCNPACSQWCNPVCSQACSQACSRACNQWCSQVWCQAWCHHSEKLAYYSLYLEKQISHLKRISEP